MVFETKQWFSFVGILLIALMLWYFSLLSGEYTLFFRDVLHNYYTLISFQKQSLLQGDWPFWLPQLFGGTPLMAGLEPPLFYPLAWFFFVLPYTLALPLNLVIHHLIAGVGVYAIGHHYRWSWLARTLAGLFFSLSGVMVAMNNFHPLQNAVAWMPWVIWAYLRFVKAPRLQIGLSFSVFYALQILSGHLEVVYYTSLVMVLHAIFCLPQFKIYGIRFFKIALFVLLGLALSALQLLPTFLFNQHSMRSEGLSLLESQSWSFNPLLSAMMVFPELNGNVYNALSLNRLYGSPEFGNALFFVSVYLGLFVLMGILNVLFAMREKTRNRSVFFWIMVALFNLFLAFGHHTPIHKYALGFPGMAFFRYPSKFLIVVSFSLALAAGFGWHLFTQDIKNRRFWVYSSSFLGVVFLFALGANSVFREDMVSYFADVLSQSKIDVIPEASFEWARAYSHTLNDILLRQMTLCMICAVIAFLYLRQRIRQELAYVLLILIATGDLLASGINSIWMTPSHILNVNSSSSRFLQGQHLTERPQERMMLTQMDKKVPPPQYLPHLKNYFYIWGSSYFIDTLENNYSLLHGFRNAYGFYQARTAASNKFANSYQWALKKGAFDLANQLESLASARYLLVNHPSPEELQRFIEHSWYEQKAFFPETSSYVFENLNWQARARFVYQAMLVPDDEAFNYAFSHAKEVGFNIKHHVLLVKNQQLQSALAQVPSQEAKAKQWTEPKIILERNQELKIEFETNTSGYLILSDQYIPGWTAWDNGKETPILQANLFHRAIRVSPGKHQIAFHYDPPGLRLGLIISGIAAFLSLLLLLVPYLRWTTARNEEVTA